MTKKKPASPADKLPKHPPKRTGKRGIQPLDADKDFHEPVRKEPAKGQQELLNVAAQPTPSVQHNKMAAHFVRFVPDRSKDRNRVVYLDFSLELEDVHMGKLPREVEDAWKDLKRGSIKRVDPEGMGSQNLAISIVPDSKADLEVVAAVSKASISRVTQKGKGKERKVTRLQIRFLTALTDDVAHLCETAFDETVWLQMEESQLSFTEDQED